MSIWTLEPLTALSLHLADQSRSGANWTSTLGVVWNLSMSALIVCWSRCFANSIVILLRLYKDQHIVVIKDIISIYLVR